MQKLTIYTLGITLLLSANLSAAPYIELGPMLGHVGEDTASIWFKASGPGNPSVVIGMTEDLTDGRSHAGAALVSSKDFMESITIKGLATNTCYFYAVALDGVINTPRPFPSFTTAPPHGTAKRLRVAFSSCLGVEGSAPAAAWAQMDVGSNADLVLLLGDNHYADTTARDGQAPAYFAHRDLPAFRSISSRVPVYSIWDDHDYGPNDSDATAVGKEGSLETFKQFWPNPAYGEPENPGVYYKFTRGEVEFFMLDVRYHRSPDKMIDDGTKTMLGERQLEWLKEGLKTSKAKVKIIASGSEWQRHSHADSWSSYPRERDAFFDYLKEENITGILLVSGDRHFTGGYQIGGELIEVTAGPLGSRNFPTKNLPEMFFNQSEGKLYAVFDIDTTSETPKVSIEVHRPGDGIVHNQELPWAAILGQQKLETLPIETTPEKAPFQLPFDPPAKQRVVILTDISNEPDDQMSLVRFLTYANEFDVEGILATTSCWRKKDPDLPTIRQVIDAYGKAHENLKIHAPGYPTAEQLQSITLSGVDGYSMSASAEQLDNAGIAHLIKVLEKDDPRPIWFCVWGGGNTLGGAVMKLKRERPNDVARLVSKIRGYEIALQDDGFAYIAHHFPKTKLISARLLWKGISRTTPKFNKWPESWGGNDSVFDAPWIKQYVQEGHGPLGEQYPSADYLWEGDTPSFLYLMPNGLSDPERVHYGSWGGRFDPMRKRNVRSGTGNETVNNEISSHDDYAVFSDASDSWNYEGKTFTSEYATIFRWREHFQNDFAARMDWCVADNYSKANHNPIAHLNGDASKGILSLTAKPGKTITLSSKGSSDPDGDALSSHWMLYPEAGTFSGDVKLNQQTGSEVAIAIPNVALDSPKTIHVILTVEDNGDPRLVSYQRAIISIAASGD